MLIYGEELEFDEKAHAYKFGGKFVPGVTSILQVIGKPALIPWAAKMTADYFLKEVKSGKTNYDEIYKLAKGAHRAKVQEAADIGSNVHEYAEMFFKKKPLPEIKTDQAKRGIEAFHKWFDSHNVKILASERRILSKKWWYAGTTDFIAEIDGIMGVGDIKTSSGIYPEMRLQTAAYQNALQEEKGIEFPVRWIVRFDKKTGDFEAKSFQDFEKDFRGFGAALNLYSSLKQIEGEAV